MAKVDEYEYRVVWSRDDGEFVGLCSEFPSLSWLDPKPDVALLGVRKLVQDVLEDMEASGEAIPAPRAVDLGAVKRGKCPDHPNLPTLQTEPDSNGQVFLICAQCGRKLVTIGPVSVGAPVGPPVLDLVPRVDGQNMEVSGARQYGLPMPIHAELTIGGTTVRGSVSPVGMAPAEIWDGSDLPRELLGAAREEGCEP